MPRNEPQAEAGQVCLMVFRIAIEDHPLLRRWLIQRRRAQPKPRNAAYGNNDATSNSV
jgi:hypothetical protein